MSRQSFFSRCLVLCLLTTLSACSIYSLPGSQPAPVEEPPEHTQPRAPRPAVEPGREPAPPATDPAVRAAYQPLLEQAAGARERGDYEQALSLLERAQRIDPGNPDIYLAMAQTHSARGDASQARATAERGLLYCSGARQCDALRRYTR